MGQGTGQRFDLVVIGCGMAGMSAAIRAAQYDLSVLIVERHNAPGGLNSFYARGARKFDVGLHAVTNCAPAAQRLAPLNKLCRQLRIDREALDLCPQHGSRIAFPGVDLRFTNEIGVLEAEVAAKFPRGVDGFRGLREEVARWLNGPAHEATPPPVGAREVLAQHIGDPALVEMLLCPILYYGSPREHDLPFADFCVLWQALFEEGFARPHEGVRTIIRVLLERLRQLGVTRRMRCGARRFHTRDGRAVAVELEDGSVVETSQVISTAGARETWRLCGYEPPAETGRRLTFVETQTVLDVQPEALGWDETIVFFNDTSDFSYVRPPGPVDYRSGVICFPNNYHYGAGRTMPEGLLRVTALADYAPWVDQPTEAYTAQKAAVFAELQRSALRFLPPPSGDVVQHTVFTDMFTPRTIVHYTGHAEGAVYGSPDKRRRGDTPLANVYLAGTDQGYVGIVGAALSGVTIANHRVLAQLAAGNR